MSKPGGRALSVALALAVVLCATVGCASAPKAESAASEAARVASWINSVDRSKLEPLANDLSGESTPVIGGSPYRIRTRASTSGRAGDMAEQYVYERLTAWGLASVRYQPFERDGVAYRNVIGEIRGKEHPDETIILGTHLDSASGGSDEAVAPGADDNASSVAASLYMAKLLADEQFGRTIRFVFFDGEEVGHFGSDYYARTARAAGENIVAEFGPDMLAYNVIGGRVGLHTRPPGDEGHAADLALARRFVDVAREYHIPAIRPAIFEDGNKWSDHEAFWRQGYPALMIVQDFAQYDPRNHSTSDTVAHFAWPYYIGNAKALLGAVVLEAEPLP